MNILLNKSKENLAIVLHYSYIYYSVNVTYSTEFIDKLTNIHD